MNARLDKFHPMNVVGRCYTFISYLFLINIFGGAKLGPYAVVANERSPSPMWHANRRASLLKSQSNVVAYHPICLTALAFYILSVVHTSFHLYGHYVCDNLQLRSRHVHRFTAQHQVELSQALEQAKFSGECDKFASDVLYVRQCGIVNLVVMSLIMYLTPVIAYQFIAPFDFSFVRSCVDFEAEFKQANEFVYNIALEFFTSKRLFNLKRPANALSDTNISCDETKTMLDKMLSNFSLIPANRKKPWLKRQALLVIEMFLLYYSTCIGFSITNNRLILLKGVSEAGEFKFDPLLKIPATPDDWQDVWTSIELLYLNIITHVSTFSFIMISTTSYFDQWHMYKLLEQDMRRTIKLNTLCVGKFVSGNGRLVDHQSTSQSQNWQLILNDEDRKLLLTINERLLHFYLAYKIYVVQLKPIVSGLPWVIPCALAATFFGPLILTFHAPYVEGDEAIKTYFKQIMLQMCVAIVMITISTITIVAVIYKCGTVMYKRLHSLFCLITSSRLSNGQNPYNQYLLVALSRELLWPDLVTSQFGVRAFGITFTHTHSLKLVYYTGI